MRFPISTLTDSGSILKGLELVEPLLIDNEQRLSRRFPRW